jgi:hypothetical protein
MGGKKNETPNAHEQRPAFAYDKIDLLTQTKSLTTTDNAGKTDVLTQAKETYKHRQKRPTNADKEPYDRR